MRLKPAVFCFLALMGGGFSLFSQILNEGFAKHLVDEVHADFGLRGKDVVIGILSDGYQDYTPAQEVTGTFTDVFDVQLTQSGSVLAEVVHSLAPASHIRGYPSGASIHQRVNIINQAVAEGCHIILLNARNYPEENPYQESVLHDTIRTHAETGTLFIAASGNRFKDAVWSGDFASGGFLDGIGDKTGAVELHLFDGRDTNAISSASDSMYVRLYWNEPQGKANSDYDLFAVRDDGDTTVVVAQSLMFQNGDDNPYESLYLSRNLHGNLDDLEIVVTRYQGEAHKLYLEVQGGTLAKRSQMPQRGISQSPYAIAVGAVKGPSATFETHRGNDRNYSPYGLQDVYFNSSGEEISTTWREAPQVFAQDGVTTSLSLFNEAFGTEIAAAQTAGIAALLFEYVGAVPVSQFKELLGGGGLRHSLFEQEGIIEPVSLNARWLMENADGGGPQIEQVTKFIPDYYLAEGDDVLVDGDYLSQAEVFVYRDRTGEFIPATVISAQENQLRFRIPRIEGTRITSLGFTLKNALGSYRLRGNEPLLGTGEDNIFTEEAEHYPPPQLTGVDDPPIYSGYYFTLRGQNLADTQHITLDGQIVSPSDRTRMSRTSISYLSVHTAPTLNGLLEITTRGGSTTLDQIHVQEAPEITHTSAARGKAGDVIDFYGERLAGLQAVLFERRREAEITVHSDSHVSAVIPQRAVSGEIVFNFAGFQAILFSDSPFIVLQSPEIEDISPRIQTITPVTLRGDNMDYPLYVEVLQNGQQWTVPFENDTTFYFPADISGSVNVRMVSEGGTSNEVQTRVVGTPVIDGMAPGMGEPETVITLRGDNFLFATDVLLNGASQFFAVSGYHEITVKLDATASTGIFEVVTPTGTAKSGLFLLSNNRPVPQVHSIVPHKWISATIPLHEDAIRLPKIFGANLRSIQEIRINGVPLDFYYSQERIVLAPREGQTSGPLELFYGDQRLLAGDVQFVSVDQLQTPQLDPIQRVIMAGEQVELTGEHLEWLSNLGRTDLPFTIISDTRVSLTAPADHVYGYTGSWAFQAPWNLYVGIPFHGLQYEGSWVEVNALGWLSYTETEKTFFSNTHGYLQVPQPYNTQFWYFDVGLNMWCYFNPVFFPWTYSFTEGWTYYLPGTMWPNRWLWSQNSGWFAES